MNIVRKNEKRKIKNRCIGFLAILIVICLFFFAGKFIYSIIKPSTVNASNMPVQISEIIPSTENEYIKRTMSSADIYWGDLILINYEYEYLFDANAEKLELVSIYDYKTSSYKVKDTAVSISPTVIPALNNMLNDFYTEYNVNNINIISGHRTYEYQETLFANSEKEKGLEYTQNYVAKPGQSEHHTGLAIDLGIYSKLGLSLDFNGSGKYSWINSNAYKYGFIVRYPESKKSLTNIAYEPWHFRYVGIPHSCVMSKKDICFEEYISYLKNFAYGEKHLLVTTENNSYEIYYIKGTEIFVPKELDYTVSGNNIDGFIVTVSMK